MAARDKMRARGGDGDGDGDGDFGKPWRSINLLLQLRRQMQVL